MRGQTQTQWRDAMLRTLPGRWAHTLRKRLATMDARGNWIDGNTYLRDHVETYGEGVFSLDASLSQIREAALRRAEEAHALCERLTDTASIMAALTALCARWKIEAPVCDTAGGAIARMIDPAWWGRRLRTAHGRRTEAQAVRLGLVSAKRDKYISEENKNRGAAQQVRNAQAMERTFAVNEDGEVYSLASLIAKSVSNKVIRRGELMLRMRGMEEVAADYRCWAEFAVVTAPSRFHAVRGDGSVNEKYDDSTARECQNYLQGQWRKCRAWLHRHGVAYFGMRTVEAHQDGTPHWNLLVFLPDAAAVEAWRMAILHYFLDNDSADEDGARERRVRFESIDEAKGGATGYIAKYISKNVDGYGLTEDLAGDPILESVQRVELWSKLWGIRQFQPIGGGGSVTVWRELRRVDGATLAHAPDTVQRAWLAAQRVPHLPEEEGDKRADYAEFIRACGGPYAKRSERTIWLHKIVQDGLGRYGEPLGMRPAGVVANGVVFDLVDGNLVTRIVDAVVVPSVRRTWAIVRGALGQVWAGQFARHVKREESVSEAQSADSRTRVNNCTVEAQAIRPNLTGFDWIDDAAPGWRDETSRWAREFDEDMARRNQAALDAEAETRRAGWRAAFGQSMEGLRWMQ
jgi:hypothetical protein